MYSVFFFCGEWNKEMQEQLSFSAFKTRWILSEYSYIYSNVETGGTPSLHSRNHHPFLRIGRFWALEVYWGFFSRQWHRKSYTSFWQSILLICHQGTNTSCKLFINRNRTRQTSKNLRFYIFSKGDFCI